MPFQRRSQSDMTAADERIMTVLAQDDREHRKRLRDLKLCYKCERPLSEGCGGIKTCQAPAVGSRVARVSKAVTLRNPIYPQEHLNMLMDWIAEDELEDDGDVNALIEEALADNESTEQVASLEA